MRAFFLSIVFFAHVTEARVLCLDEAFNLALVHSPALSISRQEIEIKRGGRMQSGAYFNPEFAYSVENVFGNKRWRGWDSAESRYELSQTIELVNKRGLRQKAAAYELCASYADYRRIELALCNELKKKFLDLIAAQEFFALAQEQKSISDEIFAAVKVKVQSGKISPIYQNKAALEKINGEIVLAKARLELETLSVALALFWAESCPDFDMAEYPFYHLDCPACIECYSDSLSHHPEILKARFLYSAACERVAHEKAERIPNMRVLVGYKSERECNEHGMIIGASIPLPVFDCNGGNIYRAEAEMGLFQSMIVELELKLDAKLKIAHKEALRAYQEASTIQTEVLALAEEGFSSAKKGYEEGKFEYLDLLDAKRTLFEIRSQYIQALLQFLKKKTDIEYLTI